MAQPPNKKVPESAAQEKEVEHPVYITGYVSTNGKRVIAHNNPTKPNDSWESEVNHDGSFVTKEINPSFKGLETSHTHHRRSNNGTSSENNDGHKDESNQQTKNTNTFGDGASQTAGKSYIGAKQVVNGNKEGVLNVTTGGKTYESSKGDVVKEHTGKHHHNIEGDNILATSKGTRKEIVKDGDFAINVQTGNFDADVKSKLRLFSEGKFIANTEAQMDVIATSDMLIKSDTKITLQVGGSKIEITPSGIKLTASRIDLN